MKTHDWVLVPAGDVYSSATIRLNNSPSAITYRVLSSRWIPGGQVLFTLRAVGAMERLVGKGKTVVLDDQVQVWKRVGIPFPEERTKANPSGLDKVLGRAARVAQVVYPVQAGVTAALLNPKFKKRTDYRLERIKTLAMQLPDAQAELKYIDPFVNFIAQDVNAERLSLAQLQTLWMDYLSERGVIEFNEALARKRDKLSGYAGLRDAARRSTNPISPDFYNQWHVRQETFGRAGRVTTTLHTRNTEQEARDLSAALRREGYSTALFHGNTMLDWEAGEEVAGPAYSKGSSMGGRTWRDNPASGPIHSAFYSGIRKLTIRPTAANSDYSLPYADETGKGTNVYRVFVQTQSGMVAAQGSGLQSRAATRQLLTPEPVGVREAKQVMLSNEFGWPQPWHKSAPNPASASNPLKVIILPDVRLARTVDNHVPVSQGGTWTISDIEDGDRAGWMGGFHTEQDALDYAQNVLSGRDSHYSHPQGLLLSRDATARNNDGYSYAIIYNTRWQKV